MISQEMDDSNDCRGPVEKKKEKPILAPGDGILEEVLRDLRFGGQRRK